MGVQTVGVRLQGGSPTRACPRYPLQPGVYILNDLMDGDSRRHADSRRHHRRRHRLPRGGDGAAAAAATAADAASAAAAAAEAFVATPASGLSDGESEEDEGSGSSSDIDADSSESDSEAEQDGAAPAGDEALPPGLRVRKLPTLASAAAAVSDEAAAPQPPLVAFSRDAAERLWREQHLAAPWDGPEEVTGLALDLMLLSTMCSGNDYLPAIQVRGAHQRRLHLARASGRAGWYARHVQCGRLPLLRCHFCGGLRRRVGV